MSTEERETQAALIAYIQLLRGMAEERKATVGFNRVDWAKNRRAEDSRDAHTLIAKILQDHDAVMGFRFKLQVRMAIEAMERLFDELLAPTGGWPVPSHTIAACGGAILTEGDPGTRLTDVEASATRAVCALLARLAASKPTFDVDQWLDVLEEYFAPSGHQWCYRSIQEQDVATERLHRLLDHEATDPSLRRAMQGGQAMSLQELQRSVQGLRDT